LNKNVSKTIALALENKGRTMGFHMLQKDVRKKELINFRVSKHELAKLKEEAANRDIDLSSLIRERVCCS